jgi:uncharacterized RDD family membrane protein YckC
MNGDHRVTYEGFGRRMLAGVIDCALAFLLIAFLVLLRFAVEGSRPSPSELTAELSGLSFHGLWLLAMVCSAQILFWRFLSATPGMLLMGCEVVRADNARSLSMLRSLVRCAGLWLGLACLGVGVLWIIWDPRQQGLHDKLVGSVVIKEDESRVPLDELVGGFE